MRISGIDLLNLVENPGGVSKQPHLTIVINPFHRAKLIWGGIEPRKIFMKC